VEHIVEEKVANLEMNAAIHGAEVKGSRRKKRRERKASKKGEVQNHPQDATPEELAKVGIFG